MIYRLYIKLVLDVILGLLLFLITFPIFIVIAIFLFCVNKQFPFFIQPRPGKNCKIFKIVKFKTMNDERDMNGNLLPDIDRLTKIGKFVRTTSLDELPQLLNVIKGEMSFVGPRPLLVEYLPQYSKEQAHRHNVRPGITGWAQVNGRNSISWQQKFDYDVWYVNNLSFGLDLKIILLTIKKILIREGISQVGQATMEPFKGNN